MMTLQPQPAPVLEARASSPVSRSATMAKEASERLLEEVWSRLAAFAKEETRAWFEETARHLGRWRGNQADACRRAVREACEASRADASAEPASVSVEARYRAAFELMRSEFCDDKLAGMILFEVRLRASPASAPTLSLRSRAPSRPHRFFILARSSPRRAPRRVFPPRVRALTPRASPCFHPRRSTSSPTRPPHRFCSRSSPPGRGPMTRTPQHATSRRTASRRFATRAWRSRTPGTRACTTGARATGWHRRCSARTSPRIRDPATPLARSWRGPRSPPTPPRRGCAARDSPPSSISSKATAVRRRRGRETRRPRPRHELGAGMTCSATDSCSSSRRRAARRSARAARASRRRRSAPRIRIRARRRTPQETRKRGFAWARDGCYR